MPDSLELVVARQRKEIEFLRAIIGALVAENARLRNAPDDCPEFGAAPCASGSEEEDSEE